MDVNSLTMAYDKQIYNVQFYRDPNFVPTEIDETTGKPSASTCSIPMRSSMSLTS